MKDTHAVAFERVRSAVAVELDAERVRVGAEPDIRKVMVGSRRVPYWQGGRAYQPYAQGYFGAFSPMDWMFMGMLFGGGFDGLGEGTRLGLKEQFSILDSDDVTKILKDAGGTTDAASTTCVARME